MQKSEPFLRQVLARYISENNFMIERGEFGKPYLRDFPELHFNVSHSGTKMVLAISHEMPVGIDIEQIKSRKSLENLVKIWSSLPAQPPPAVRTDFRTAPHSNRFSNSHIWVSGQVLPYGVTPKR